MRYGTPGRLGIIFDVDSLGYSGRKAKLRLLRMMDVDKQFEYVDLLINYVNVSYVLFVECCTQDKRDRELSE